MVTRGISAGMGGSDLIEVGVEKAVGQIKIGNNVYTRYVKIVDFGALPNATSKTKAHGATFINMLGISGTASNGSGTEFPLPRISTNSTYNVDMYISNANINITTATNLSAYSALVCLEYYR